MYNNFYPAALLVSENAQVHKFFDLLCRFRLKSCSGLDSYFLSFTQFENSSPSLCIVDCSCFKNNEAVNIFFRAAGFISEKSIFLATPGTKDDILKYLITFNVFVIPFPCNVSYIKKIIDNYFRDLPISKNISSSELPSAFHFFSGTSAEVQYIRQKAYILAQSSISILLQGESGTGKTLLANIIHNLSDRKSKNFVSLNMAAIPENIAESELFGTVAGAFTGAIHRDGYFAQADEGTLFMDEIAEMPLSVQAKLLKVLDDGSYTSVGSVKSKKCNIRLICATNENLENLVRLKRFRADLYHRIADSILYIPPLRERKEDIIAFADSFFRQKEFSSKSLSLSAKEALKKNNWTGNIRQLEKCLKLSFSLCRTETIEAEDLIF